MFDASFFFSGGVMQEAFYIGKRTKKRKGGISTPLRYALIFLCLLLALSLLVHFSLLPKVRHLCMTALSNRLEALANQKAYSVLEQQGYSYTDFILLAYDANGSVRSASVDTVKLNLLKTKLASEVLTALYTHDVTVTVPVGNLLGLVFFSGKGPNVPISAQVSEGMHARFHSSFTTSGFNQTRHVIGFSLHFAAVYLLAGKTETLSFDIEIPVAETLIVGDVPDTLTQISRLSDDITEIEIDDAVDFGNILS